MHADDVGGNFYLVKGFFDERSGRPGADEFVLGEEFCVKDGPFDHVGFSVVVCHQGDCQMSHIVSM